MTLEHLIDELAARRRTLTVYAAEPRPELARHFDTRNVEVRFDRLPEGTAAEFVTVKSGEEFLGSFSLATLTRLGEQPVTPPWAPLEDESDPAPLLELLDDTLFQSFDRRQLLAASREFEDRAWREGQGELHAGFQRPGAFRAQRAVYRRLATQPDLGVHVYFDGRWDAESIDGVTIHPDGGEDVGRFWFVAFDGGDDPSQACALLAEERGGGYDGFWTYDAERVEDLFATLTDHQ